jgi:hypothetical protein
MFRSTTRSLAALAAIAFAPCAVLAHGFVGQRFFPASLATEDPFVADELSLPTVTSSRFNASDDSPAGRQTTLAIDFSKRITSNFGLSFGTARERFSFGGAQAPVSGQGNLEIGAKYMFYKDEAAESIMSAGVDWEVGGTGSKSVAEDFSTYTPTLYFGKGFGNLKSDLLRPLAATGSFGVAIPSRAGEPHVLQVGLALEYSLPYLQSSVKDIGLGEPWKRVIPIVEIAAQKPLDRVDDRRWVGTINPGLLWTGRYVQLGLEAVIPMNRSSGHGVGVLAQLHFFLDDLFPHTFGQPLMGNR